MPPGPKNKGGCPSDLHLKLPDDVRILIDEIGPGRYQDKIIDSIRRCTRKRTGRSSIEIQSEIFKLKKEHKRLTEKIESLWSELEISCNLNEEELSKSRANLQNDIDIWWKGDKN